MVGVALCAVVGCTVSCVVGLPGPFSGAIWGVGSVACMGNGSVAECACLAVVGVVTCAGVAPNPLLGRCVACAGAEPSHVHPDQDRAVSLAALPHWLAEYTHTAAHRSLAGNVCTYVKCFSSQALCGIMQRGVRWHGKSHAGGVADGQCCPRSTPFPIFGRRVRLCANHVAVVRRGGQHHDASATQHIQLTQGGGSMYRKASWQ